VNQKAYLESVKKAKSCSSRFELEPSHPQSVAIATKICRLRHSACINQNEICSQLLIYICLCPTSFIVSLASEMKYAATHAKN
jgi:hypothetical protein